MAAKKATKAAEKITPVVEKEVKVTETEAVKAEPAKTEAAEEKTVAKKTTAKKTTTKKTTTKKAATAKKETTKKAAEEKKETAPKTPAAAKKAAVFVEFDGRQVSQEDLIARIIAKWCDEEGKKASAIKELNVYIKPEDNAAYYVINGQGSSIEL